MSESTGRQPAQESKREPRSCRRNMEPLMGDEAVASYLRGARRHVRNGTTSGRAPAR